MNEQIKQQIFDEIRAADRIVLTRHKRPDGDALGSTLGFAAVLRAAVDDILATQRDNGSFSCVPPELQPDDKGGDLWERKYVMLGLDRYADFAADDPAPVIASLKRQADAILREIGPNKGQSDIRKLGWSFNHIESSTLLEPMMRLYTRTQDPRYLAFAKYIIAMGGTDGRWDIFRQARDWTIPREIGGVYPKAYEMLSVFEGACEYYRTTGDSEILASIRNLFTMILEREMTLIGNGGGDQPFHPDVYGEAWGDTALEQTNPAIKRMMETCTGVTWPMRLGSTTGFAPACWTLGTTSQFQCGRMWTIGTSGSQRDW